MCGVYVCDLSFSMTYHPEVVCYCYYATANEIKRNPANKTTVARNQWVSPCQIAIVDRTQAPKRVPERGVQAELPLNLPAIPVGITFPLVTPVYRKRVPERGTVSL